MSTRLIAVSPLAGMAGGEAMLMRLLPELAGRGWSVRLAVPARGALSEAAAEAGIPASRLPLGPPERRTAASYVGALAAPLPLARADVVLLNGLSTQRLVPALRLARRPAILHVTNPLREFPRAWSRRGFWKRVRAVLADSRHSAEECVVAGAPPERVHAIPPPAWSGETMPGARSSRGAPLGRVAFVGQIEPRKGVAELIEAAADFLDGRPDASLTIVGEPPGGGDSEYARRVRRAVARSPVGERIELAGYRPDAAEAMVEFDLVVVPSLAEPYGTVAAEAAAAGAAVVASRVGGLPEVVEHGETGLLVPPGSSDELAAAIGELLDDRERLRGFGQRALQRAGERFSPRLYANRVEALLLEALDSEPYPRPT